MRKSQVKRKDILIARSGSFGKASIYLEDHIINSSDIIIVSADEKHINPYFLVSFLNSRFGINQMIRFSSGGLQGHVNLTILEELEVPKLEKFFQEVIEKLLTLSYSQRQSSKNFYTQAEELLLTEIGLNDFQPTDNNINVKSFADSFGNSGRLDAEYYQPKYEEVENLLKKNGFSLLADICSDINYGTVPTSTYTHDNSGIPYIKGMNLKNTEIKKYKLDRIFNTEKLASKFYTKTGDIIISQMGTVGDVGVVRDEENWLFASFTIRARLKSFERFNPIFVGLYIQNIAKKYYLYRNIAQASVRQNTDLPTIRNLYVPNVEISRQQQIADLIEQSFALKKQSEHLLAVAKRAVEIAIEENEAVAMAYINKEV